MDSDNTKKIIRTGPVLYLARHGETEYNRKKIFQGRSDIPLNQNGLKQAQALASLLASVPITHAFVSPLQRAVVTAGIILKGRNVPVKVEHRLIEINFGAWEGTPEAEVKEKWADDYMDYRSDMSRFHPESGESAVDAQKRAGEWWDEISGEFSSPVEHILVVAHQSLNAVLACHVVGIGLKDAWEQFKTRPGEVIRIVPTPIAQISKLFPEFDK